MGTSRYQPFFLLFFLWIYASPVLSQVPAVVDAANKPVGFYGGPAGTGALRIVSSRGYAVIYYAQTGRVAGADSFGMGIDGGRFSIDLLYMSADCSGPAYIQAQGVNATSIPSGQVPQPGFVFKLGDMLNSHLLFFAPKGAQPIAASDLAGPIVRTSSQPGACTPTIGPPLDSVLYQASPNAPGTTGVQDEPFTPPLIIDTVPVSDVFQLFKDGFESAQALAQRTRFFA